MGDSPIDISFLEIIFSSATDKQGKLNKLISVFESIRDFYAFSEPDVLSIEIKKTSAIISFLTKLQFSAPLLPEYLNKETVKDISRLVRNIKSFLKKIDQSIESIEALNKNITDLIEKCSELIQKYKLELIS